MPDNFRLDRAYAQLLRHHPYGWALYKKVTARDIHPGSCGYFDSDGDWRTLADLTSPKGLARQGWTTTDGNIIDDNHPESMIWGPKSSSSVQSTHIGGSVGAIAAAASVKATVKMSFKSSSGQGAVLATESPVVRHQYGDESSALQWMADNTAEMMRRHGDIVKRHGIWVITKTYLTRRCAIAIIASESSAVEIGLDVDVQGLLSLTPNSAWNSSSGTSCTEIHEDEEGVVVFISGIYFSRKAFRSRLGHIRDQDKQRDMIFRGDRGDESDDSDDTELNVEFYPDIEEDESI
ncbi:hypothetical protein V8C35DRAFT_305555 [Trichoderma chlorosporum]